jgi:hypothetical protein
VRFYRFFAHLDDWLLFGAGDVEKLKGGCHLMNLPNALVNKLAAVSKEASMDVNSTGGRGWVEIFREKYY